MKKLRMFLAAALALSGAGTLAAQPASPPAPGLFPSTPVVDPVAGQPTVPIAENSPAPGSVPRMWFMLGPGLWWATPTPNPSPILTTSAVADAGIIGAPSTVTLIGQQTVDYGTFATLMFNSGSWWNADRTIGSEGTVVWSEQLSRNAFFTSDITGTPALFRPIIDPVLQGESSVPVALPGQIIGSLTYETRMKFNQGDTNLMVNAYRDESRAITGLVGYRLMYVREEARMIESQVFLADNVGFFNGTPLVAGDTLTIRDRIETVNRLYIAQVGLKWERFIGAVNLEAHGKLGIGWSHQRIYADGRTTLEPNVLTVPGGVLVQQSFPYRNQIENFAFVPEFGATARIRVLRRLQATISYNFLYVSDVARPGRYFDRVVELTQVPTSNQFTGVVGTRPTFMERMSSDMIVHGFNFGFTWAY